MSDRQFRILLLDTKYRNPNHYICLGLRDALARQSNVEFVAKADPNDALSIARKERCNLFIAFDGEELNRTLCGRLASQCGQAILWVTEDPYERTINIANSGLFDLVFTNDSASVAAYGDKGRHLPLAAVREFHDLEVLPEAEPLRYELFFAGTAWPNRAAFFQKALPEFPAEWRFKIALPTNSFLPPVNLDLPESQISWRTSPIDFARFVNNSVATLLLPREFSASGNDASAETPPPRLFEAALAGGVQLVHTSMQVVAESFSPGTEFLYFSTEREMISIIETLRNDRLTRNRIADAARRRALAQHCYDHRAKDMLTELGTVESRALARADVEQRKRLLFVTHNVIARGYFGGVEVYIERIRQALGGEYDIFIYAPGRPGPDDETVLFDASYRVVKKYKFSNVSGTTLLSCSERERAFWSVLRDTKIDLVHFQHLIGHVPSLVQIAAAFGTPTFFSVHDFYAICNEFNLLSFKEQYCNPERITLAQCDVCLLHKHQIEPGAQGERRAFMGRMLAACDRLVFNTAASERLVSDVYPQVATHPGKRILPVPIDTTTATRTDRQRSTNGKLKVAVLGNVTMQKGGKTIMAALSVMGRDPIEFHIFGRVEDEFLQLQDKQRFPTVMLHGVYAPDDLPAALLECDISLHVSIWPETYCLTLSEALHIGLVPIVTDIGAIGERVQDGVNGLKIPVGDEGALISAIRRLNHDRTLLQSLRDADKTSMLVGIAEHVRLLEREYEAALATVERVRARVSDFSPMASYSSEDLGIKLNAIHWAKTSDVAPLIGQSKTALRRLLQIYVNQGVGPVAKICLRKIKRVAWRR